MTDSTERRQLTHLRYLTELLVPEFDKRDRHRSERRIKAAGFPGRSRSFPSSSR
jgi:hypothetical protein